MVDKWMMMYINEPVANWKENMDQEDIASIGLSFCGFLTATLTVVFDNDQFLREFSLTVLNLFAK